MAHYRVFFDKRSGKAERIEQFIAERGIEYGYQIVTQFFLNSLNCLYTKKFCDFLQSYEKTRELQKEKQVFLFHADLVDVSDIAKVISIMAAKARVAAVVDEE
ncbi:MAG: hypothetical protein IKR50_06545 [Prevotella sp.]|nr:hypothetical protein [Prevotella sp.]